MENFLQVTPFLHVPDMDEAIRFFTEILGFTVYVHDSTYAYVHRETVGFRLQKHSPEDEGSLPERDGIAHYIDVRSMDDLMEELRPKLAALPPGHVRGLVDQIWGQRELMIRTPDRRVLVFGQAISPVGRT